MPDKTWELVYYIYSPNKEQDPMNVLCITNLLIKLKFISTQLISNHIYILLHCIQ